MGGPAYPKLVYSSTNEAVTEFHHVNELFHAMLMNKYIHLFIHRV